LFRNLFMRNEDAETIRRGEQHDSRKLK